MAVKRGRGLLNAGFGLFWTLSGSVFVQGADIRGVAYGFLGSGRAYGSKADGAVTTLATPQRGVSLGTANPTSIG